MSDNGLQRLFPGQRILGWVLSIVPTLGMLAAAVAKFLMKPGDAPPGAPFDQQLAMRLGMLILALLLLYWILRTAFLGVILLTGYLGGAAATDLVVMHSSPVMPVILGMLFWSGYMLRNPQLASALGWVSPKV